MQELLKEEDISEENIKKYLSNYSCFITCTLEKSNIVSVAVLAFIFFSVVVIIHSDSVGKVSSFFLLSDAK